MRNTRLIIRLMGLGEAQAEGFAAVVMLVALAALMIVLAAYTGA